MSTFDLGIYFPEFLKLWPQSSLWSGSHQAVIRQSSGSHQTVVTVNNWTVIFVIHSAVIEPSFLVAKGQYSELSNKHAANLILFEKIFPPTCLIRTYTFIYFQGKFLPTRLLEYLCLLILAEIPNYKIILSSFKLLFCCFKHFKEASRS